MKLTLLSVQQHNLDIDRFMIVLIVMVYMILDRLWTSVYVFGKYMYNLLVGHKDLYFIDLSVVCAVGVALNSLVVASVAPLHTAVSDVYFINPAKV